MAKNLAKPRAGSKTKPKTEPETEPADPRAGIDIAKLVNMLQEHALGVIEIERERLQSITLLLKKTLPDLTATEAAPTDRPPAVVSARPLSAEEWETIHGAR